MTNKIVKAGNITIRLISEALAVIFIIMGSVSLWCTFRSGGFASASEDLVRYRPEIEEGTIPCLDEMREINPDVNAWLIISGTDIDYPVLQGKTDMEYINKDAYGNFSISGAIFLSVLNKSDYSEPYQLIYGHHMENGSMFGSIDKFTDEEFFYNHGCKRFREQEGSLITDGRIFDIRVFALLKTDAFDPLIYRDDSSPVNIKELLEYVDERAVFRKDTGKIDHVLALSTCDSGVSYGRTVLMCSLTEHTGTVYG